MDLRSDTTINMQQYRALWIFINLNNWQIFYELSSLLMLSYITWFAICFR